MGLLDTFRGTGRAKGPEPVPKAVVAAAMPMSGPGVQRVQRSRHLSTTEEWQRQAWYYFDTIGELRGPLVWIANAVSQADVHATDLDADTGKPTGPSEDMTAQAVAAQFLGGPSQQANLLRLLALCWQVAGEAWIIIRPPERRGKPDRWLVLSGGRVKAKGEQWSYTDPFTASPVTLGPTDRLIRVWQPHPDEQSKADSACRPAIPICAEIEKSSQNIAARLDSRLSQNGLLLIADELDMPKGDHPTTAALVTDQLLTAAEYSLNNPGQASAQVPLALNAPAEWIAAGGAVAHIDFTTEFDAQVVELRSDALRRLAATLDMPRDVAEGTQGESNHWSAWQVEESTYKIFIEPLLKAIGDAGTEHWYQPALMALGWTEERAEGTELGWDTTAVTARPDDRETLESLYDKILISDEYMLTESGVPVDAMPSREEYTRRFLEKAVLGAPTLLADPNVTGAMDLGIEVSPVAAGVDAEVGAGGELETPEPPPPPALPGATPDTRGEEPVPEGLVAAAELIVYDALSRAGGRLLTNQNRGRFKTLPRHELHTATPAADPYTLLEGSFQFTDRVADAYGIDRETFTADLHEYCYHRLRSGKAHDPAAFRRRMRMLVRP
jgi:hypothetical protein